MFGIRVVLLLASLASLRVAQADFMVYTQPPIPSSAVPSFANQQEVRREGEVAAETAVW